MSRILAIGGGELSHPGCAGDTTELDAEVVRLADTRSPRLVFLPTATGDDVGYIATIREHYGRRLGCRVEPLALYDRSRTMAEIERSLAGADIVYVGGGNTLRMMKLWRRRGVDRLLMKLATGGTVLAGVSAGAICCCTAGVSDSRSFTAGDDPWVYITVRGLGLIDVLLARPTMTRIPGVGPVSDGSRGRGVWLAWASMTAPPSRSSVTGSGSSRAARAPSGTLSTGAASSRTYQPTRTSVPWPS